MLLLFVRPIAEPENDFFAAGVSDGIDMNGRVLEPHECVPDAGPDAPNVLLVGQVEVPLDGLNQGLLDALLEEQLGHGEHIATVLVPDLDLLDHRSSDLREGSAATLKRRFYCIQRSLYDGLDLVC